MGSHHFLGFCSDNAKILIIRLNSYCFFLYLCNMSMEGTVPTADILRPYDTGCHCHISVEHRGQFCSAHNGLRVWHLHHDDAAVFYADIRRGHHTIRASGYHNIGSDCVEIAELYHLAAPLAYFADIHYSINNSYLHAEAH